MSNLTTSLADETEALREAYAALNRYDVPAFVKVFDPQVERIEHFPQGETLHGLEAMTAHVTKGRGSWAEGSCEPERFLAAGDKVVVFVHVRVRVKNETEWREGRLADVYTFRGGKAIQFHSFADQRQALAWAGVDASEVN